MHSGQALVVAPDTTAGGLVPWQETAGRANEYVRAAKAEATRRAYRSDWCSFEAWCAPRGLVSLPADPRTVALYLTDAATAGAKVATMGRRLAAISKAHQAAGYESPAGMKHAAVWEVWKGIRRTHGVAQMQKAAAVTEDIRRMIAASDGLRNPLLAVRDRALLLTGFAGAPSAARSWWLWTWPTFRRRPTE